MFKTEGKMQHTNSWCKRLYHVWTWDMDLKMSVFFYRLLMGALPLTANLHKRGISDGKCSRCNCAVENVKHAFWYCPIVKEWWNQLCTLLFNAFGYKLSRFQITFGLYEFAAEEIQWVVNHLRAWFIWGIWVSRNLATFQNTILYATGIPWGILKDKLLEDAHAMIDTQMRARVMRVLHSM